MIRLVCTIATTAQPTHKEAKRLSRSSARRTSVATRPHRSSPHQPLGRSASVAGSCPAFAAALRCGNWGR
eukprot:11509940-Prorocentrum_lima.AAC.1